MLVGFTLLLALALGAALRTLPSTRSQTAAAATAATHLSSSATLAISRGLGADLPQFRVSRAGGGYAARNPRQHLRLSFDGAGARIAASAGAHASIALQAIGSGAALDPVGRAQPLARGNRVEYRRGAASEWFANGPAGLEQGFTIARRPTGAVGGELTLALGVSGTLTARPGAAGGLVLAGAGGKALLRYGDLSVSDATGRSLPAHMTAAHGRILIGVDTRGARYPLRVDPLLNQVGELYSSIGAKEDELGEAVAASGATVVVGNPEINNASSARNGSAYVFTEGPGGWATATQAAKLVPKTQQTKEERFGASVAISGKTIVVGAPGRESGSGVDAGSADIFVEPTHGWGAEPVQHQAVELINSEDVAEYEFGKSVTVSGETIVVGAPLYRNYEHTVTPAADGAAFVFLEPAGGWGAEKHEPESQTATIVPHEAEVEGTIGHFGESVAIGQDGAEQTVAVGAPGEPVGTEPGRYQRGVVFLLNRPAGGWAGALYPNSHLTASNGTEFAKLGESVAISGSTLAAGATRAEVGGVEQGATYVFTKPAGGWTASSEQTQAAELTSPGGSEFDEFGKAVAVEGSTVAVASRSQPIFLFTMPAAGWSGEQRPTAEFYPANRTATATGIGGVGISGGEILAGNIAATPPEEKGSEKYAGAVDVVPFAPLVTTGESSGTTETTASVAGVVDPDQTEVKSCSIEYGTTTSYGEQSACSPEPTNGVAPVDVSAALSGLAAGTTYHYRVVAANVVDTSYGEDATFTTVTAATHEKPTQTTGSTGGSPPATTTSSSTSSSSSAASTSTTPGVASTSHAIEEVLLGCSNSQLVLNDVYIDGGHVAISGSAAKSFVGKKVKIVFNERKQVATATVAANGQYSTTAPLPPAKIREALTTRYSAEIGKLRSLHLKLTRRLLLEPPTASGTTVTLAGQITLPLTKPVAPVIVEEQLECGKTTIAKTFTPPASGRFHVTVTVPADARAGIFTLKSKVAANAHSLHRGFTTYSLPLPVSLG
jgi:FG-GAP repeat